MTPRGSRREAGPGRCRGCGLRHPAATRSRDRSSQHAPVLVARWPAVRTCGLEPSRTGPSSFGFCGPARRSRTVSPSTAMRCTSSPTSACTASAPIAPAARTSIRRGATATPESPSPARSTPAPGRRRRSARRPGRDHRQRRPDGRGRVPHRYAAAPPSAPRRLPGAGVRQERKRQRELTDRLRPLTERRKQLRLPGPIRPPHRCDHTAPASRGSTSTSTSTAAGWCGQTTPRAPQRGYQSSPRQPRQDRALGASASGADQPRAHGSTSPPPRLSPPPLSCHLARSRETAPPGDSGHEIRARRAPDMRPELGKTRTCASTNAGLA